MNEMSRRVARVGELRITYKILVGNTEKPLRRPMHTQNNINMNFKGIGWEGVAWIHLAPYRVQW